MKRRPQEEALRKQLARTSDAAKQLDILYELAAMYRYNGDLEAARDAYSRAVRLASNLGNHLDLSFGERALAEVCAEEGDRKEALEHARCFREAAKRSGNYSQIQLSLHVTGWVFEKLNVQQSHDPADLEEALLWCLQSMDYIRNFGHKIDIDREAVRVGGNSARRKAGLERLCSGLCANLQRQSDAEKYWNAAYAYARRTDDVELEYQLLLARIDFSWESPVKNAQRLVNFSPAKKKGSAIIELAQELHGVASGTGSPTRKINERLMAILKVLMYAGDFLCAQNALLECLLHHRSSLVAEDAQLLDARVIFLYKYFKRLDRTRSPGCDRKERRRMYELIADSFCFYGGERKEMLEHALKYYKLMFDDSESDKERFSAAISVAQTLIDLHAFDDALEWLERALFFEVKLGRPEVKLLQTRVLMFEAKTRRKGANRSALSEEYDSLNSQIPDNCLSLKLNINEAMGQFLSSCGYSKEASIYLERCKEFRSLASTEESEEDSDCEDFDDDLESRPDKAILTECMELAITRNSDREIEKDRDKEKNAHGETRLHIAARSSDTAMLEKLIAAGYNLNKRDHGGWTPISEAVSAGIRDNVRALLKAGAHVDPVSTEVLNDDESSTGSGITPLMEACDKGFIEIAEDLLEYGASVVKKNSDGWTPVDFLRNFIVSCRSDDAKYIADLTSLAKSMEEKQRQQAFPVRGTAPCRRKSSRAKYSAKPSQAKSHAAQETTAVTIYKRVIGGLGALSKEDKSRRLHDESALFYDSNSAAPICDENAIPNHCEDRYGDTDSLLSNVYDNGFHDKEVSSVSASSAYLHSVVSLALKNRKQSGKAVLGDGFLMDSEESSRKKRKKRDSSSSSREKVKRLCSHEADSSSQSCVNVPSTSRVPLPEDEAPVVVTLRFEDKDGRRFLPDKSASFMRNAKVIDIEAFVRAKLSSVELKSLNIRLLDGKEVDPIIPLSMLDEPLIFLCRVVKRTSAKLFDGTAELLEALGTSGVLDLSLPMSNHQQLAEFVLRKVVDDQLAATSLILDGLDLSESVLSSLSVIFPSIKRFSCRYAGAVDCDVTSLHLVSSLNVHSIDLSHNEFTSGFVLSHSLLSFCPQLLELSISNLEIQGGEDDLITAICGLSQLQLLDISFNSFLRGSLTEKLLSSCEKIRELRMDGCDLSNISFESTWLPYLRELSMVGCLISDFDSLVEWMSMGSVQQFDLSATDVALSHVQELVASRLLCPAMVVRLISCPKVECDARAFSDMMVAVSGEHSLPIRFAFSEHFITDLQTVNAFCSNFLTVSTASPCFAHGTFTKSVNSM